MTIDITWIPVTTPPNDRDYPVLLWESLNCCPTVARNDAFLGCRDFAYTHWSLLKVNPPGMQE